MMAATTDDVSPLPSSSSSSSSSTSAAADRPNVCRSERVPLLNQIKKRRTDGMIANYYDNQVNLLHSYHTDIDRLAAAATDGGSCGGGGGGDDNPAASETSSSSSSGKKASRNRDALLAKIVLGLNSILLILKITAVALSNSIAIISTLVESAVDLVAGVIILVTSSAISHRNHYEYPVGRNKLEPLAVIFISIITGVANIQLIIQAIAQLIENKIEPKVDVLSISILCVGILLKIAFCVYCLLVEGKRSSGALVLAQDARNDVITNVVAVACAFVGSRYWLYADAIGAIAVCSLVAINWFRTAAAQVPLISGKCAPPEYINRIIRICAEHDPRIRHLETVLVYHYGQKFLVEVHIVLDAGMPLKEAHDILEPLQRKLETLDFVERAFVHPDYECFHKPSDEHKVV